MPVKSFNAEQEFFLQQIKVVRMGEPDASHEMFLPKQALAYWFDNVATAPWFDREKECIVSILCNTKHKTTGFNLVSIGSLNESVCHPREVFRPAVAVSAFAILLMHNHPSGNTAPSTGDEAITKLLLQASGILNIRLLDHVIVGRGRRDRCFSFRESGLIPSQ